MRNVLIVGLSALGEGLARYVAGRVRLFAIDRMQSRIDRMSSRGHAELACFDAADPVALGQFLGGTEIHVAVVAIGGDFLSAEQVAETLRDLKAPDGTRQIRRIIVTANRPYRADILEKLGHAVVRPMIDAADSLAALVRTDAIDEFSTIGRLRDDDQRFGVAHLPVPARAVRIDDLETELPGLRLLAVRRRDGSLLAPAPVQSDAGTHVVVAATPELAAEARALLDARAAEVEE